MRVYELKSWWLSWPFKIKLSTLLSACKRHTLMTGLQSEKRWTGGEHLQVEHFYDTVAVLEPLQQTDLIAEPVHHLQSRPLQVNDLQRTDILLGVQHHVHLQQSKPADSFTDPSLQSLHLLLPRPSGISGRKGCKLVLIPIGIIANTLVGFVSAIYGFDGLRCLCSLLME